MRAELLEGLQGLCIQVGATEREGELPQPEICVCPDGREGTLGSEGRPVCIYSLVITMEADETFCPEHVSDCELRSLGDVLQKLIEELQRWMQEVLGSSIFQADRLDPQVLRLVPA